MTGRSEKQPDRKLSLAMVKLVLNVLEGKKVSTVPNEIVEELLDFSRSCGLHCLVAKALAEVGNEHAGEIFRECITQSMFFHRDLVMLDRILAELAYTGAVLLKGGSLKYQVYPDTALRPSVDIDLLVNPKEIYRVVKGFLTHGFQIDSEAILKRPVSGRLGYDIGIRHPDMNFMIEVHRGLSQQFRYSHPVDRLIMQAGPISGFANIRAPSLQWQMVHGAIHMAQRGFKQSFKHLLDIHILKKQVGEQGVKQAFDLAELCGARRALYLTIKAAEIAFEYKQSPWNLLFSNTGPEVLNTNINVVLAQVLTGFITTDSTSRFMRALLIKGSLLPLDLAFQKIICGSDTKV